ncbi:MAG TPA: ADP-ribosylglycohydrolase family protein [Steroidobacteraceae bacterium]|nr:ADP-ribosylglycohydrolase family protein [Steroidobacteraceae bacterium]
MNLSPAASALAVPLPNTYWVVPGRLLAGEYPGGPTAEATRERLSRLLQAGIDCFLDLTHPGEIGSYAAALPAGVQYLRRSILDHGTPEERGQMVEILECLRGALHEGSVVYVHCRAGIGRTGMVVGCLLAEQGLIGEAALDELNRLWRQSARSGVWPTVPETLEQVEYVRGWLPLRSAESDPLLEPATLEAARGLRERFQGTLLGLATGDAVAAATQHRRAGRFTPVGDMLGGGPFDLPRGAWSDDTAMALCLAESLLEREGFDARDQVARYRRWQQEGHLSATGQCVGITSGTARALALAQWRRQLFSGTHDPTAQDPESLSRVAPVVMYFFAQGPMVAAEQAAQAARTTCQAPLVLESCRALAQALHVALSGGLKSAILAAAALPDGPPAGALAQGAPAVLAAALEAFDRTANFREAVLAAANLGGNSDVIGTVCGAIAGAHYSAGAIPALWRDSLMQGQWLEGYADRLLTHALLGLG